MQNIATVPTTSATSASMLVGWRKILISLLPLVVAALNTAFATSIELPADYSMATLIAWMVTLAFQYVPTIVASISSAYYVKKNVEQDSVHTRATAAIAQAQATTATTDTSKKAKSVAEEQPAAAQSVQAAETYQPVDLDALVVKAEANAKNDGLTITPLNRAYYFYPFITQFDLRKVPRQQRIEEAKKLVDKGLELFTEAFKFQTKLAKVPTAVQSASIHSYMLTLKKEYEKANNLTCSDKTFEDLRNMVCYFNDLYSAQDGLVQIAGKTVDWSIYGSGAFTPTQVGWDYAKLV